MSLAQELKQRAREAGAALAGIAQAQPAPEAALLPGRLADGLGAALSFLKRDSAVRQDIRRWYPQARSVLVCGFCYSGAGKTGQNPGTGRIARYAVHEDYHRDLKQRMSSVLSWWRRSSPGADGRPFVDSSPVLERVYAAAAGLGWIGRNCLLVSETIGSFFLIAGLALNKPLDCDRAVPNRCGSCRRCIDACPTGALGRGSCLDAGRCTSYLTIEHRGPIPRERRAAMGRWVAGCDLCQEACPWNGRRDGPAALQPLLPQEAPLEELALTDETGFHARFGATPLTRLKRQGLVRNALLAMGNSQEPRFRKILEGFLQDPDPVLREQALWSLARLPS